MKLEELHKVREILLRITNRNSFVNEALAYVDKDIALREQQSKAQRNLKDVQFDTSAW